MQEKKPDSRLIEKYCCTGLVLGIAIGAALGNVGMGIGVGIALGVALGAKKQKELDAETADSPA